ncbi:hypothetical protein SOPP22_05240 [Shewanella sp. OPT22]|nr:hypothetical protein SOPP22_05240 [Shewanella sp. OPT22]
MAEAGIPEHVTHNDHVAFSSTVWKQDQDQDKQTATFNLRIDGYFSKKSSATYDVKGQKFSLVVKKFLGSGSEARDFKMSPDLNDPTSVICNKLVLHYAPISILKAEILKNPSDLLLILDQLSSERAFDLFISLLDEIPVGETFKDENKDVVSCLVLLISKNCDLIKNNIESQKMSDTNKVKTGILLAHIMSDGFDKTFSLGFYDNLVTIEPMKLVPLTHALVEVGESADFRSEKVKTLIKKQIVQKWQESAGLYEIEVDADADADAFVEISVPVDMSIQVSEEQLIRLWEKLSEDKFNFDFVNFILVNLKIKKDKPVEQQPLDASVDSQGEGKYQELLISKLTTHLQGCGVSKAKELVGKLSVNQIDFLIDNGQIKLTDSFYQALRQYFSELAIEDRIVFASKVKSLELKKIALDLSSAGVKGDHVIGYIVPLLKILSSLAESSEPLLLHKLKYYTNCLTDEAALKLFNQLPDEELAFLCNNTKVVAEFSTELVTHLSTKSLRERLEIYKLACSPEFRTMALDFSKVKSEKMLTSELMELSAEEWITCSEDGSLQELCFYLKSEERKELLSHVCSLVAEVIPVNQVEMLVAEYNLSDEIEDVFWLISEPSISGADTSSEALATSKKAVVFLHQIFDGVGEEATRNLIKQIKGNALVFVLQSAEKIYDIVPQEVILDLSTQQLVNLINCKHYHWQLVDILASCESGDLFWNKFTEAMSLAKGDCVLALLNNDQDAFAQIASDLCELFKGHSNREKVKDCMHAMLFDSTFSNSIFSCIKEDLTCPVHLSLLKLASEQPEQMMTEIIDVLKSSKDGARLLKDVSVSPAFIGHLIRVGDPDLHLYIIAYLELDVIDEKSFAQLRSVGVTHSKAFNSVTTADFIKSRNEFALKAVATIMIGEEGKSSPAQRAYLRNKLIQLFAVRDMTPEMRCLPTDIQDGLVKFATLAWQLTQVRHKYEDDRASTLDDISNSCMKVMYPVEEQLNRETKVESRPQVKTEGKALSLRERHARSLAQNVVSHVEKDEKNELIVKYLSSVFGLVNLSETLLDRESEKQQVTLVETKAKLSKMKRFELKLEIEKLSETELNEIASEVLGCDSSNMPTKEKLELCKKEIHKKIIWFEGTPGNTWLKGAIPNIEEEAEKVKEKKVALKAAKEQQIWGLDELSDELIEMTDALIMERLVSYFRALRTLSPTKVIPESIEPPVPQAPVRDMINGDKEPQSTSSQIIALPEYLYAPEILIRMIGGLVDKSVEDKVKNIKTYNQQHPKKMREYNEAQIKREKEKDVLGILYEAALRSEPDVDLAVETLGQYPSINRAPDSKRKSMIDNLAPKLLLHGAFNVPYSVRKELAACTLEEPIFRKEELNLEDFKSGLKLCLNPFQKNILIRLSERSPASFVRLVANTDLKNCTQESKAALKDAAIHFLGSVSEKYSSSALALMGVDFSTIDLSSDEPILEMREGESRKEHVTGAAKLPLTSYGEVDFDDVDVQALMALNFLAKVTSKSAQVSSQGKMTPLSELISKTMLNVLPQYKGGAFYYKLLLTEQAYPGGRVLFDTREYEEA